MSDIKHCILGCLVGVLCAWGLAMGAMVLGLGNEGVALMSFFLGLVLGPACGFYAMFRWEE